MTDVTQNEERAYGWDDEIKTQNEFELLPEGDYDFTVLDFERQYHDGSEKLPECNISNVRLQIVSPNTGDAVLVFHRIPLHSKMNWLITQFFVGIGQTDGKSDTFKPNWDAIAGTTGRVQIEINKYNNKESNRVKKFYPKNEAAPATAAANKDKPLWS